MKLQTPKNLNAANPDDPTVYAPGQWDPDEHFRATAWMTVVNAGVDPQNLKCEVCEKELAPWDALLVIGWIPQNTSYDENEPRLAAFCEEHRDSV